MSRFLADSMRTLAPYTPGEQPQGMEKLIKLNTNENSYPPAPGVIAALDARAAADLRLYSDPACKTFLAALARTLHLDPAQVFAGNGSDEVLAFAFRAFCGRGAAFPDVTYGFYPVFARMFGVAYEEVPLRADFSVAPADYAGRAGTVFLANPNAPTGMALSPADIETLLRQDRDRLVVVDEAYVDFGGESVVPLLDAYDNLLVVGTFSKSRSLAGARLGYAAGSRALIAELNTVKYSFNPYNINRLTLAAGTAALADPDYFSRCCAEVCAVRAQTAAKLAALGFRLTDSRANFLFAAPPAPHTGAEYYAMLRENGILVRHFDAPRTTNFVRITIGTKQQMDTLLAVTGQWLKGAGT